ncbi:MlaD family protein [Actinomadura sp. NPDC047616]|uniref:MlaD family protein n=1 Tax=Actinomadura sp. NPDC047616 TaxID=3155914 RepID=UPI0033D0E8D1
MILKPGVKIQLLVFAVITVIGVYVVTVNYIGLGREVFDRQYTAYVDLTDSGGVFTGAEVTYRGVAVGRVGPIQLTRDGIRVKLELNRGRDIPRDGLVAVVANRSAVGEQYIDLQPARNGRPYLHDYVDGRPYTIPRQNTRLPVSTAELLRNVNTLIERNNLRPENLRTIVDELDKAFSGSAADLQRILDDTDRLLKTADEAYPATKELLDNSRTVLDTQRAQGADIRAFARNLNQLTTQLRRDDPALRSTIDAAPPAVGQLDATIDDLAPTLPVLLANMTSTGQVIASRQDGLRSLFILYPIAVAGAFTVTPGDGTQHLGLAFNINAPAPCTKGYEVTQRRWPQFTGPKEPPLTAGCKEPADSDKVVRGTRNFPKDAIRPYPKVPAGATDGAGFPPGGADGGSSGSEGARKASGEEKKTEDPKRAAGDDPGVQPQSAVSVPLGPTRVELAGYDPSTGWVYGPDGKRYGMGWTGGQQRLLGEAGWKMLLLGPLGLN